MLILILAFSSISFSATLSYEQGVRKVRKLIAVKKHVEAERLLTVMLKEYPGNSEILSIRGRVRLWMGKMSNAEKDFRRSLLHRENSGVRAELSRIESRRRIDQASALVAKGDLPGAERILKKLFISGRARYRAGLMLARLYTSHSFNHKATAVYRLLHREFPLEHDVTLLYVRGLVRGGETARAEKELARLKDKNHPLIHVAYAVVLASQKQYEKAVDHYKRSLHLRDDTGVRAEMRSVESLLAFHKADELTAAGDSLKAEQILRIQFDSGVARYKAGHRLARLLIDRNEFDNALSVYLALAEDHPSDTDTLLACSDAFLLAGDASSAWTILSLVKPDVSYEVRVRRGRVLYRLGRFPESVGEFRRAIEHGAESALAVELAAAERAADLGKANKLYEEGRIDEAEHLWRDLFVTGRERYESGLRLSRLYRDRRELVRAASILEKLRGFYPADTDIMFMHLDTMLADGRLADVERELSVLPLKGPPQLMLRNARLMYRLKRFDESVHYFRAMGDSLEPGVRKEREAAEKALALEKAQSLMRAGRQSEAIDIWDELFNSKRERYESGYQLGMAYLRKKNYVRAGNHFSSLSNEFPADPGLYALAIESHVLSRDTATANKMVNKASLKRKGYLQRERQDLLYRIHPNSVKLSGLVAGYSNDIPTGYEMSVSVSQQIHLASMELHASSVNRYDHENSEIGAELGFPFTSNRKLRGIFAASFSPDAQFLPRTTFRGEVSQALGKSELSLGYSSLNFRESNTNILILGFMRYLPAAFRLSERLYIVPERGSLSLLSTIHFQPHHRFKAFYSLGLGNSSEYLRENEPNEALLRFFSLTNRIGAEYRPIAAISVGAEIFHEYLDTLYSRYGIKLFTRYWW